MSDEDRLKKSLHKPSHQRPSSQSSSSSPSRGASESAAPSKSADRDLRFAAKVRAAHPNLALSEIPATCPVLGVSLLGPNGYAVMSTNDASAVVSSRAAVLLAALDGFEPEEIERAALWRSHRRTETPSLIG